MAQNLVRAKHDLVRVCLWDGITIPDLIARGGDRAAQRFLEFFAATIRNRNTRDAYYRACCRFLAWSDNRGLAELANIHPIHVSIYVEELAAPFSTPTVKQHLAAIRMLLDWMVTGGLGLLYNPASPVRGPSHVVKHGKTPILSAAEARDLLDSIDIRTVVGLRDRALIGLMIFTFARVSAAINMKVEDYYRVRGQWWVRLQEKGGKRHELPAHSKLQTYVGPYLETARIARDKRSPLFRSTRGRSGQLTARGISRVDAYRMIQRRATAAGLSGAAGCHTFRATGITAYIENGGLLEAAQRMANHESPRTTKLYDRSADAITTVEVEKVSI